MNYNEKQKFNQWWMWAILFILNALAIFAFIQQIILGEQFGQHPMSDTGIMVMVVLCVGLTILFRYTTLYTKIDDNGIHIRYTPFVKRSTKWEEIESMEVIDYGFVGWGIRFSRKYTIVFNVKGSIGLHVRLKSGKQFVVGTQRVEEVENIVKTFNIEHKN